MIVTIMICDINLKVCKFSFKGVQMGKMQGRKTKVQRKIRIKRKRERKRKMLIGTVIQIL